MSRLSGYTGTHIHSHGYFRYIIIRFGHTVPAGLARALRLQQRDLFGHTGQRSIMLISKVTQYVYAQRFVLFFPLADDMKCWCGENEQTQDGHRERVSSLFFYLKTNMCTFIRTPDAVTRVHVFRCESCCLKTICSQILSRCLSLLSVMVHYEPPGVCLCSLSSCPTINVWKSVFVQHSR